MLGGAQPCYIALLYMLLFSIIHNSSDASKMSVAVNKTSVEATSKLQAAVQHLQQRPEESDSLGTSSSDSTTRNDKMHHFGRSLRLTKTGRRDIFYAVRDDMEPAEFRKLVQSLPKEKSLDTYTDVNMDSLVNEPINTLTQALLNGQFQLASILVEHGAKCDVPATVFLSASEIKYLSLGNGRGASQAFLAEKGLDTRVPAGTEDRPLERVGLQYTVDLFFKMLHEENPAAFEWMVETCSDRPAHFLSTQYTDLKVSLFRMAVLRCDLLSTKYFMEKGASPNKKSKFDGNPVLTTALYGIFRLRHRQPCLGFDLIQELSTDRSLRWEEENAARHTPAQALEEAIVRMAAENLRVSKKFNALERGKAKKKLSQHEYESQLQVLGMQSASFRRLEDAAHMIKNKFVLQLQTVEAEMEEEAYWDGFYRAPHTSGSTAEIEHMMRSTRFTAPTTAATSTSTSTSASKLKSTSKSQESGSGSGLSSRERARERGRRERERETERGSGEARDSSSVMYEADDEKKPRRRRHKK